MSSSRRSSRQSDLGGELFLECKAAFLSIYDDINDKIESKKRLNNVLQQSGRNPTRTAMDKYWPRNTDELSFNDFVDICRKEPVTTADDLMKAFRKIDINGDGYISLDELYKIMNAQGENMTRDDVRKMIDEVDENKDGRLDYSEFTNMIMKTTEESKQFSMKVMEKKERKKRRGEKLHNSEADTSKHEPEASSHRSHDQASSHRSHDHDLHTSESTKKDSPKASPRSRSDSGSKNGSKKPTPREHTHKESVTKEMPRRDHHAKHDKPPLPDSPKSKDSSNEKSKSHKLEKAETQHTGISKDSARSVGEEIDYDDDFDIVSTGRPTPRIDLNATPTSMKKDNKEEKKETTKNKEEDKVKEDDKKKKDAKESARDEKGNTSNKSVDSPALAYTANRDNKTEETISHRSQDTKHSEKSTDDKGGKLVEDVRTKKKPDDIENASKLEKENGKLKDKSADDEMSSTRLNKPEGVTSANDLVDEIFKSRRSSKSLLAREFDMITHESTAEEHHKHKDDSEQKQKESKTHKGHEFTPKVAPRKDKKDAKMPGRSDKEISTPVPSPRKSVSRLSEDDVPRPSPRVKRDAKGKSPSTKGRDKLPDPKSLQDWMHYTSKGCFFYEEDEIVTHVYSLKLTEDSCVYLSAYPIQEPSCLNLPGAEPIDTALFVFDSRGKLVTCTESRDTKGTYGVKCDLSAGEYQVLPYTTGCRFKQRSEETQENMKESKLVKTKDDKVVITSAFRRALEDIFDLCDLDNNGTMSRDEFNWFNLRTSGEELGEDEWEVVEEKTALENGEITKQGFIELNEMEAEDAQGDVEDLWITLTSMGMNKGLIMDEACPFRVDVYVEESGRKKPSLKVTGIESLEKKEFVTEICQYTIEKAEEPTKIRNMKDLYMYTYRNENRATIVIDNRSRSNVSLQVNCSRSKNVVSNRAELDHTVEVEPQNMAIAHHLLPKSELSDWTISCTENILK